MPTYEELTTEEQEYVNKFKEEYLKASKRAKEDIRVYKKEYKNN